MVETNKKREKEFPFGYFKSILEYNPETGILIRKYKNGDTKGERFFNTRFAGKAAGSKKSDGYLEITVDYERFFLHRVAYLLMIGEWPNKQIDHINGIKDDNRWENLRAVSNNENRKNQKIDKRNSSGKTGVYWNKRLNKWRVQISVNKKRISLGFFHDFDEAVKIRKEAEKKYGYHENHGRKEIMYGKK